MTTEVRNALIGVMAVAGIVAVFASQSGEDDRPAENQSPADASALWPELANGVPVADAAPSPTLVTVLARDLAAAYDANEVAADSKYKGKAIRVVGKIQSIGKDVMGTPYIALRARNEFDTVQCMFDEADEPALAALKKGSLISVLGDGAGYSLATPLLEDCQIEEPADVATMAGRRRAFAEAIRITVDDRPAAVTTDKQDDSTLVVRIGASRCDRQVLKALERWEDVFRVLGFRLVDCAGARHAVQMKI